MGIDMVHVFRVGSGLRFLDQALVSLALPMVCSVLLAVQVVRIPAWFPYCHIREHEHKKSRTNDPLTK